MGPVDNSTSKVTTKNAYSPINANDTYSKPLAHHHPHYYPTVPSFLWPLHFLNLSKLSMVIVLLSPPINYCVRPVNSAAIPGWTEMTLLLYSFVSALPSPNARLSAFLAFFRR